jgi:hypothetical protein
LKEREEKQKGESEEEESQVPSGGRWNCASGCFKGKGEYSRKEQFGDEVSMPKVFYLGEWRM